MHRQPFASAPGILAGAVLVAATLATAGSARADLPPPNGQKFVDFAFTVDGLAAAKDFVLLAYPCGDSNGTPSADMAEIKDGVSVSVGRRGGTCKLYSMRRADFDAWRTGVKGNSGDAVRALFEGPQVRACTGGPNVVFVVPSSDPRSVATQALHVAKLDAAECSITTGSAGTPAPSTPRTGAPPTETPPVNRGCAACAVEPAPGPSGALAVALSWMGIALGRRSKRSR